MISIIVPIYNAEKYLHECVDSIIAQTYSDWELILVDDGSTDSSGAIADAYQESDSRIKAIHINNGGLSWARNHGLKYASGEVLSFVDADDALFPYSLTLMINHMDNETDIVEGGFSYGKSFKNVTISHSHIKSFGRYEAIKDVLFQKRLVPSACGKLYKRDLFNGIKFREGLYYEDLDIFYHLFLKCRKLVFINSPVYFYRENPDSFIHTWNERRLDVLDVTERIEKFMTDNYPELIPAARDRRLSANFNMFILATKHNEDKTANRCWSIIKKYRKESLFNTNVRLKNKIGILLSYFGKRIFGFISCAIY